MAKYPKRPAHSKQQRRRLLINAKAESHQNYLAFVPGQVEPNFEYTFTGEGYRVTFLEISTTIVDPILNSDKIYGEVRIGFFIDLRTVLTSPDGNGTFQLKYLVNNKDVFSIPQKILFRDSGRGGLFFPNVKLPK